MKIKQKKENRMKTLPNPYEQNQIDYWTLQECNKSKLFKIVKPATSILFLSGLALCCAGWMSAPKKITNIKEALTQLSPKPEHPLPLTIGLFCLKLAGTCFASGKIIYKRREKPIKEAVMAERKLAKTR